MVPIRVDITRHSLTNNTFSVAGRPPCQIRLCKAGKCGPRGPRRPRYIHPAGPLVASGAQIGCPSAPLYAGWETKEVRQIIHDVWKVDLSDSQVGRILREKLKMHNSKPYPYDYRRPLDAEEQLEDRLNDAFNRLNERGVSDDKIAIVFLDEASPQTTANTARVWHTGHAAKIIKNTTRYKANAFGFYAIVGHSVSAFPPNSKKESVAHFLETILDANRDYRAIVVILDNFSSHHADVVQDYARSQNIDLVYLPPYSPDLNPIEFIWKSVNRRVSPEFIESVSFLKQKILQVWNPSVQKMTFAKHWIEVFVPSLVTYCEFCK